jgi:hypothetical protein
VKAIQHRLALGGSGLLNSEWWGWSESNPLKDTIQNKRELAYLPRV